MVFNGGNPAQRTGGTTVEGPRGPSAARSHAFACMRCMNGTCGRYRRATQCRWAASGTKHLVVRIANEPLPLGKLPRPWACATPCAMARCGLNTAWRFAAARRHSFRRGNGKRAAVPTIASEGRSAGKCHCVGHGCPADVAAAPSQRPHDDPMKHGTSLVTCSTEQSYPDAPGNVPD